ncbi:hypothetical protein ACSBOB_20000 [Mesorhizobium sp. ASY16-5R]|uniref:hypothetical protein n=1 Tax=Mesorhizobium sp. ASY16-5R TaxID=3445772 RepID=UPI003F9EC469
MTTESYVEFAGLTAEAVRLIEGLRRSPDDTKSQILVRSLTPLQKAPAPAASSAKLIDYKEGIRLPVGEKLYLFLAEADKNEGKPDAEGEIRADGFYMDGKLVPPRKGRPFQPAMEKVQNRKKHFSKKNGGVVSLSSIRQWCVKRDGRFVTLEELKDPDLKRTRGPKLNLTLEDLNL